MKRESITALCWYFLNCSVTQFYWVQVFSSPKYIHVSEESSTNLLLINKLLLTKDEEANSYKQYLRGCRMILSQIFSLPPPHLPFPPASSSAPSCGDLVWRTPCSSRDWHHTGGEGTQPRMDPAKLRQHLTQGTQLQGSHLPAQERPHLMLTSEMSLDPYSITSQKPSSGPMPAVAMLLRLWEVASYPPSILTGTVWAARGDRSPPSPVPCLWFHICLIQPFCWGVWEWGNMLTTQRPRGTWACSKKSVHAQKGRAASSEPEGSSPGHSPAITPAPCCHFGW